MAFDLRKGGDLPSKPSLEKSPRVAIGTGTTEAQRKKSILPIVLVAAVILAGLGWFTLSKGRDTAGSIAATETPTAVQDSTAVSVSPPTVAATASNDSAVAGARSPAMGTTMASKGAVATTLPAGDGRIVAPSAATVSGGTPRSTTSAGGGVAADSRIEAGVSGAKTAPSPPGAGLVATTTRTPRQPVAGASGANPAKVGAQTVSSAAGSPGGHVTPATFEAGSSDLHATDESVIASITSRLKSDASAKVTVVGHASSDGSTEGNMRLSRRRAESFKALLVERGVQSRRIQIEGKGSSDPIASNAIADGRRRNRRVEVEF